MIPNVILFKSLVTSNDNSGIVVREKVGILGLLFNFEALTEGSHTLPTHCSFERAIRDKLIMLITVLIKVLVYGSDKVKYLFMCFISP